MTIHSKHHILHYAVITACFFLISCGGDDKPTVAPPQPPAFGSEYFPMADGDRWYYTNDSGQTIVRLVSGDTVIVGDTCTRILHNDTTAEAWSKSDTAFYTHMLSGEDQFVFVPPLSIPFNLPSSSPYHYSAQVFVNNFEVGTTEGDVSFVGWVTKQVPAGAFGNVAKLHYAPDGDTAYDEYYAHGVGLLDNSDIVLDSAFVGGLWFRP